MLKYSIEVPDMELSIYHVGENVRTDKGEKIMTLSLHIQERSGVWYSHTYPSLKSPYNAMQKKVTIIG